MYGKYYFEKSTLDTNVLPNGPRSKLSENHGLQSTHDSVETQSMVLSCCSQRQLQNTDVLRKGFFHLEMVDEKKSKDDDGDEFVLIAKAIAKTAVLSGDAYKFTFLRLSVRSAILISFWLERANKFRLFSAPK
ncbi:hypothetical protein T06_3354 [Trichinella sp. T6]|nr:hypothetical protein T06_3354 [Trichinella sp. T6]